MKRFLKISHYVSIRNTGFPIYNIQCFIVLSGLISSDKNVVYFPAHVPLKSAADVIFIATIVSEIGAPLEAVGKQTVFQPSLQTAAPHGVQVFSYFYSFHINVLL